MTVRPVVRLPERVLKERARELGGARDDELVADLVDTMRASPACVGLAAPQIGVARRAIVVDVTGHPKTDACHGLIVLIDPILVEEEGRAVGREGCMSVPDLTGNLARGTRVAVRGIAADGGVRVIEADAFEARALLHELDHLDGLLFLDRVDSLTADVFRRKRRG